MGNPPSLHVDTPSLTWDPAVVTVPPVPIIPAGGDPMSLLISSVMPGLAADLATDVAATRAREEQFAANLAAARTAYQSTDQAGEQEIGTATDHQLAEANPATSGTGSGRGRFMSTAMQIAGQAAQAPQQIAGQAAQASQQLTGIAASAPQSIMQQMGQLSGQFDKSGDVDKNAMAQGSESEAPPQDRSEESGREQGASAGPSAVEQMPESEVALNDTSGESHRTSGGDPMNL